MVKSEGLKMNSTFQVGDRVRIPLGRRQLLGIITEDRGAIGLHGRHLYQVMVPMDPYEPTTYELPGEEMERIDESVETQECLDSMLVKNYLLHGGLITILRSNISGGRNQPRVWLCLDSLGNVTHTFETDRGVIGGQTVPFSAIHGDRIFTPKREEVLSFLRSFRLDRSEAERIIHEVGTAP